MLIDKKDRCDGHPFAVASTVSGSPVGKSFSARAAGILGQGPPPSLFYELTFSSNMHFLSASAPGAFFAPILIGLFVSATFFGLSYSQSHIYFQKSRSDPRWYKIFFTYLLFLEAFHVIFNFCMLYGQLVTRYFDNPKPPPFFLHSSAFVIGLQTASIQCFLAWRIRKLSQSLTTPLVICVIAFISILGGIWTTAETFILGEAFTRQSLDVVQPAVWVWLVSIEIADLIIAVWFFAALMVWSKKTSVLRSLRWSLENGTVTSVVTLAVTIMFVAYPTSTAGYVLGQSIGEIHLIALLFSVNCRPLNTKSFLIEDCVVFGSLTLPEEDYTQSRKNSAMDEGRPRKVDMV